VIQEPKLSSETGSPDFPNLRYSMTANVID
jgi:hypothetical protein